jgi:two-component system phosphate regulon sensor histidine kinase PhoR
MNRILEDLLSLSRVESQGEELDRISFDVRTMITRTALEAEPEAIRRGITLQLELGEDPIQIVGNEPLLERAVGNLVDNAVKYGKERATVHIRAVVEEHAVRIEVQDEGPGIAANHLPRLFERFYRIDKGRSRELGGTGLGLAIVKHIALAHRGEAWVESRSGVGSTFFLRIPRDASKGTGPLQGRT